MEGSGEVERVFLGWDELPLDAAAGWLIATFGPEMRGVLVALPSARAGRFLEEKLARRATEHLRPPRILTTGLLSDELLDLEGATAGRLERTLAWAAALRALEPRLLRSLVARPPAAEDHGAWWRLAEEVRGLFGKVAAEAVDFEQVASGDVLPDSPGERQRWKALAAAQKGMESQLEAAGASDPHLERLRAIEAGRATAASRVVLVGVVEMNELERRALALSDAEVTALVFAPQGEAAGFDELGTLRSEIWAARELELARDSWRVVDRPGDQADAVLNQLSDWGRELAASDVTVGVAAKEVGPFVERRLAEHGLRGRNAEGTPWKATGPARLVAALARFLRTRRFEAFASLVRHPAFEAALRRRDDSLEPVELVDAYHGEHLPELADGHWLADPSSDGDRELRGKMERLWRAARDLLGPLLEDSATPMELRDFLAVVYGDEPLDPREEAQRRCLVSLQQLGEALARVEVLPEALQVEGGFPELLELLPRMLQQDAVPPRAASSEEVTVELLGWLELALDDAPGLVVVGFEDGNVPDSVRGDAFLPDRLRRDLGLVDDERRLARDLYTCELLRHSRKVAFVSGRRSLDGDPQVPSRLVFHCAPEEVVPRVKRFLSGSALRRPRVEGSGPQPALPQRETPFELERMAVTDFRIYLRSPYEYYLRKVLKLKTLDDRARELEPMPFGILAHRVLQRFGEDERLRESTDPAVIARFLSGELHDQARSIFGQRPLPAVLLQVEQLDYRLKAFAGEQARRRDLGWRIAHTEWRPEGGGVRIDVDGEPLELRGQIDRIDHHPERGAWAIWDYKTGDAQPKPGSAHRRADGRWIDLQLPLYCVLAAEVLGDDPPEQLGYAALCRKAAEVRFCEVKTWGGARAGNSGYLEGIESGFEEALEVVRRIRRGEFIDPEGFDPQEEILRAIGGLGLVEATANGEDGEESA